MAGLIDGIGNPTARQSDGRALAVPAKGHMCAAHPERNRRAAPSKVQIKPGHHPHPAAEAPAHVRPRTCPRLAYATLARAATATCVRYPPPDPRDLQDRGSAGGLHARGGPPRSRPADGKCMAFLTISRIERGRAAPT